MIFDKITDFPFDVVSKGKASNIDEFIEQVVKKQFIEHNEVIKKIHKELMKYVEQHNAIYFLRLYGAFAKDKYDLLRRGFLSEYACGNKLVFCDNTFSMLFTGAKLANISYDVDDLNTLFNGKDLVCSFGITTKESELMYYDNKNAPKVNLNAKGWYLAHLNSVGKDFKLLGNEKLKDIFINPDRIDWDSSTKIRKVNKKLEDKEKKLLQAHFLRLVHPLNSFLVPKRTYVNYEGKNLGEEKELLFKVEKLIEEIFPKEYKEFCNKALISDIEYSQDNLIKKIEWKNSTYKEAKKKVAKEIKEYREVNGKKTITEKDIENNENMRNELLESYLASVGKRTFVMFMFIPFSLNKDTILSDIQERYKEKYCQKNGKEFSKKSMDMHIGASKWIFDNNLEREALELILNSKASRDTKELADELYKKIK